MVAGTNVSGHRSRAKTNDVMSNGRTWSEILTQKEFLAGLLYAAFGVAALALGPQYRLGTASNMGPGYFPTVLGGLLFLIGLLCIARSLWLGSEGVGRFDWRRLSVIVGSVVVFAILLPRAGLPLSLGAMALLSATASPLFRLSLLPLVGLVAVVAITTAVFAYLLNVPLPVLGSWFKP